MPNVFDNLTGISRIDCYHDGAVRHCTLEKENNVLTSCGTLIPRYGEPSVRRKNTSSLSFYENGAVKRAALENQTPVKTPLGVIPAELVTFYSSGAVKRVFPLDGQISGYWSEQDEEGLLNPLALKLPIGTAEMKLIGCCFYESGAVKSLTLWPGQIVQVSTGVGHVTVRNGLSFYENGAVKSLEPAFPTAVPTPIGLLKAYDAAAIGINADVNSLELDEWGHVSALTVPGTVFTAVCDNGHTETIAPEEAVNPLDDESVIELPVRIRFSKDSVLLTVNNKQRAFDLINTRFSVSSKALPKAGCSGKSCAACGLCSS